MIRCWRTFGVGHILFGIAVFLLVAPLGSEAHAASHAKHKTARARSQSQSSPVQAPAARAERYADIVIEADTGRILHETNAEGRRHPASLTKMMTLYLTFQAIENGMLRLDSPLPVSAEAARQAPSKLGLRTGQTIRAQDAIMGLITQSANDAAVVLAEAIGGNIPQFARMMVDQARTLGMRNTNFLNPNGLPSDEQITTARDMAILGHALIYHYPGFYTYFSHESFAYKGRVYRNHNHLMSRYEGMDGIKTGYINASGFNLVASAVRHNKRLIGVIFGGTSAASRDREMEALLNDAFNKVAKGEVRSAASIPLPSKVPTALALAEKGRRREPQPIREASNTKQLSNEQPAVVREDQTPQPEQQNSVDTETPDATGGWGIQIGAFSSIDAAQQYLASISRIMAPLLGKSEQSLQKVTMTDGTAMYRTRFMGIDQKTARDACAYMVKHGQSCLVVSGP